MKALKYIIPFLLTPLTIQAQNSMDIVKTIITEKAKFLQDGVYVDKKINIVETRTQLIDTKPSQSHLLNQERLNTPINVAKIIRLDHNKDESYDVAAIVTYDLVNDEIHNLRVISPNDVALEKDEITLSGEKREAYLIGSENSAVFGFINDQNEFELHYF